MVKIRVVWRTFDAVGGFRGRGMGVSKKALGTKNNLSLKKCAVLINVHVILSPDRLK
jgi:hypothetical protein